MTTTPKIDDGGSAERNATLRDYFAANALQGMVAGRFSPPFIEGMEVQEAVSMSAYLYADAMLAVRKQ